MSRFGRVARNLISAYGLLVTTTVCGLISIPIALHYLSPERFGLWALGTTVAAYLALVDLGMSSSVGRLLIDCKDNRHEPVYGSMVKTSWLVTVVQGSIVAVFGVLLAPLLPGLLEINPDLRREFVALFQWQSVSLGLSFCNIFGHILIAHQRLDITNAAQMFALVLNLCLVWLFFELGAGVLGLAWSSIIVQIVLIVAALIASSRLKVLPEPGKWGQVSSKDFHRLFAFSRDVFLVSIGSQLIITSQTLIITRQLGLGAAAAWAVATRPFFMLCQAVWRIFDMAAPAMSEMIARGEKTILQARFKTMFAVSGALAALTACVFAAVNSLFVQVWTSGRIQWTPLNDLLLGVWLLILAINHANKSLVLFSKEIRSMRFVYVAEGIVFLTTAFLVTRQGGMPALVVASILFGITFSGVYGYRRTMACFSISAWALAGWMRPMLNSLLVAGPGCAVIYFGTKPIDAPVPRLIVLLVLCLGLAAFVFVRIALPHELRAELLHRSHPKLAAALRPLLGMPGTNSEAAP